MIVRTGRVVSLAVMMSVVAVACSGGGTSSVAPTTASAAAPPTKAPTSTAAPDPSPLIDPGELLSGGPPPDGIPPVDHPKFLAPADVTFLTPQEPVIAVEVDGIAKAYPIRILMWHEIVNDDFGGTPVVVTYCPLCNTGIAYLRPKIDGELLDFGTSGKLYHSNLVMYDRQTDSFWPQAIGQAVIGPLTGTQLKFVPARILSWADWQSAYPDGLVLSTDTGFDRDYGSNPYAGYDGTERPFLFSGDVDPRLPATEHVLGIAGKGGVIAFPYSELARRAAGGATAVQGVFGGERTVVFWHAGTVSALDAEQIPQSEDVGAAAAYVPASAGQQLTFSVQDGRIIDGETGSQWSIDGRAIAGPLAGTQLKVALAIDSFWFDWAAFHPDTKILGVG